MPPPLHLCTLRGYDRTGFGGHLIPPAPRPLNLTTVSLVQWMYWPLTQKSGITLSGVQSRLSELEYIRCKNWQLIVAQLLKFVKPQKTLSPVTGSCYGAAESNHYSPMLIRSVLKLSSHLRLGLLSSCLCVLHDALILLTKAPAGGMASHRTHIVIKLSP